MDPSAHTHMLSSLYQAINKIKLADIPIDTVDLWKVWALNLPLDIFPCWLQCTFVSNTQKANPLPVVWLVLLTYAVFLSTSQPLFGHTTKARGALKQQAVNSNCFLAKQCNWHHWSLIPSCPLFDPINGVVWPKDHFVYDWLALISSAPLPYTLLLSRFDDNNLLACRLLKPYIFLWDKGRLCNQPFIFTSLSEALCLPCDSWEMKEVWWMSTQLPLVIAELFLCLVTNACVTPAFFRGKN